MAQLEIRSALALGKHLLKRRGEGREDDPERGSVGDFASLLEQLALGADIDEASWPDFVEARERIRYWSCYRDSDALGQFWDDVESVCITLESAARERPTMDETKYRILAQLHYAYCAGPPSGYKAGGWTSPTKLAANLLLDYPTFCGSLAGLVRAGCVRLEADNANVVMSSTDQAAVINSVLMQPKAEVMITNEGIAAYTIESSRRSFAGPLASLADGQMIDVATVFVDLMGHSGIDSAISSKIQDDLRRVAGAVALDLGAGEFDVKGDGIMYLVVADPQVSRAISISMEVAGAFAPRSFRFGLTNRVFMRCVVDCGKLQWRAHRGTIHASVLDWTFKMEDRAKTLVSTRDASQLFLSERAWSKTEARFKEGITPLKAQDETVYYRPI